MLARATIITIDPTADIQATIDALGAGGGIVQLGPGTYTVASQLSITANVILRGQGVCTALDFSAAGALTNNSCIYATGTALVALPALSAGNYLAGSRSLTFASAPSCAKGDILVIYNSTNSSFSGFRTYYRAGEYVEVLSVSGNVVTLVRDLYATYAGAGTVAVYNMSGAITPQFENFKLIGKGSGTSYGIQMRLCKGARIDNVDVSGCDEAQVALIQDYNTSITRVTAHNWLSSAGAYGIVTANCQVLRVSDCTLVAYGQGISNGSGDYVGCVPNRDISVDDCTCTSMTTPGAGVGALDFHGNSEHYSVKNCDISGGVNFAGDLGTLQNTRITSDSKFGIYISECLGINFKIIGNRYYATRPWLTSSSSGHFLDMGGTASNVTANTTRGGTLTIENNTIQYSPNGAETGVDHSFIEIQNQGCTASLSVLFNDNTLTTAYQSGVDLKALRVAVVAGNPFDYVGMSGNTIRGFGNDIRSVLEVVATNNSIMDASYHGLLVIAPSSGTVRALNVSNNRVRGSKYSGVRLNGNVANQYPLMLVEDNVLVENNLVSSGNNASLDMLYATDAFLSNNWVGGTGAAAAAPASFAIIQNLQDYNSNYYGTGTVSYSSAAVIGPVSYEDDYVMHDDAIVTY